MITAGIMQGRNGGVALIQDGRLVLHSEVRQLDNNPRDAPLDDLDLVPRLLGGHHVEDIDEWAVVSDQPSGNVDIAGKTHSFTGYPLDAAVTAARDCLSGTPFPPAVCAAVGAAALHAFRGGGGVPALHWTAQLGPELVRHTHVPDGWRVAPCRPEELARLLARTGRPAVVLHGRAKPGFSSLGSRCVLTPVTAPLAKPAGGALCLESHVAEVFEPGGADPFALTTRGVRPQWAHRVPGLDAVVRVQTVSMGDDRTLTTMLEEYCKWTGGVPVLGSCDAHFDGAGPFPDVVSALRWGAYSTVWADNVLYRKGTK